MTLASLFAAQQPIPLHALAALAATILGAAQLWAPKGTAIHLLSAFTLVALWYAVHAARQGNIRRHRTSMMALFWMALILTGAFTFLPGRLMHQVVTGG